MREIRTNFRTRSREITRYLATVKFIDDGGTLLTTPRRDATRLVDVTTRRVLKASAFIHLYNLVESTVSACLERIALEIEDSGLHFGEIAGEWQESWVRELGKIGQALSPDSRLRNILELCDGVVDNASISFKPTVGAGNLDDQRIEKLLNRHGISLRVPKPILTAIKKPVVDELGPLGLVKRRRNELAHGLVSFSDCGKDVTVDQLRTWAAVVICYLRAVIDRFEVCLHTAEFKRNSA